MNESQIERRGTVPLPRELKRFLSVSALVWLLSIVYAGIRWRYARGDQHGLPELFFHPVCTDLKAVIGKLEMVHQPEFFTVDYKWIYPAPCVFLYKFLLQFSYSGVHKGMHAVMMYFLVVGAGLLVLMAGMAAALNRRGLSKRDSWLLLIGAAVLSWPIFFAVHQGNIEGILWIGVAIAMWAYYREMWWTAAVLIGIVAGFKIYPILLLGLFLVPKKYLLWLGWPTSGRPYRLLITLWQRV
jgi:hypothetical protein